MRILHIVGGMDRAGAETWLFNLVKASDTQKNQIDFLVHDNRKYDYEDELTLLGSKFIRCTSSHNPARYILSLRSILKNGKKYDIIHSHIHFYSGLALLAAKLSGNNNLVCHSHSTLSDDDKNLGRILYNNIMRFSINRFARLKIAVSSEAATTLFGKLGSNTEACYILPCGINLDKLSGDSRIRIRRHYGVAEDELLIGHVGRLEEEKNHSYLLEIFSELLELIPKAKLIVIGRGSLKNAIIDKAEKLKILNSVIFAGVVNNTSEIMGSAMDVFVFPSIKEGIPLALLEAQGMGLPTLMSDSIPEAARLSSNSSVRLSIQASPTQWANNIIEIMHQDRDYLRTEADKKLKERNLDIESNTQKIFQLYNTII